MSVARQEWTEIINADWRKSIDSIIQTGRDIIAARAELPKGQFVKMVEADLPFSERTTYRLIKIAEHPVISNSAPVPNVPVSYTILAHLAHLSPEDFNDAQERGLISEDTTKRKAIANGGPGDHLPHTVIAVRKDLEGRGQIGHVSKLIDTKGRSQPGREVLGT